MQHIGIYSGTFDPIHDGHIEFARAVRDELQLSEVIFFPEPFPRNKQHVTPIAQRVDALTLRLHDESACSVQQLPDKQFTIQKTLPKLQSLYPKSQFTFLLGSDVAAHLADWPNIATLLESSAIAVGLRDSDDEVALRKYLTVLFDTYAILTPPSFHRTKYHHLRSSSLRSAPT